MSAVPDGAQVPLTVVCELTHAAAQDIADELGADLLHLKGAALDPALRWPGRTFSDTDVLVRLHDVDRWCTALTARGWQVETSFEAGSPFGHAMTLTHPIWGYLDVHRWWPGIGLAPDAAFEALWQHRQEAFLAAVSCPVPQLVDQAVIQCLHLARSGGADLRAHPAAVACWAADEGRMQARIERRVVELDAEVAYAAMHGDLDHFAGHRDQPLWSAISQDRGRVAEWVARIRRERTVSGAARVAFRALLVNREHLEAQRGRSVTRSEVFVEFWSRLLRAARELRR